MHRLVSLRNLRLGKENHPITAKGKIVVPIATTNTLHPLSCQVGDFVRNMQSARLAWHVLCARLQAASKPSVDSTLPVQGT